MLVLNRLLGLTTVCLDGHFCHTNNLKLCSLCEYDESYRWRKTQIAFVFQLWCLGKALWFWMNQSSLVFKIELSNASLPGKINTSVVCRDFVPTRTPCCFFYLSWSVWFPSYGWSLKYLFTLNGIYAAYKYFNARKSHSTAARWCVGHTSFTHVSLLMQSECTVTSHYAQWLRIMHSHCVYRLSLSKTLVTLKWSHVNWQQLSIFFLQFFQLE